MVKNDSKKLDIIYGRPLMRVGSIKQEGWKIQDFYQKEQDLIRASRLEKRDFFFIEMVASREEFSEM